MAIIDDVITVSTTGGTDVLDLTGRIAGMVAESGVRQGQVLAFVPGSTGALTTIEYESGAVSDLVAAVERIAPQDIHYAHDARWGDGNGYSHVRAALLGPSLHIPIIDGRLALGTWQQIILLDFDNRPRQRRIIVQISGETGPDAI